jgi:transcriptional regulator with XRE-family HTH domain
MKLDTQDTEIRQKYVGRFLKTKREKAGLTQQDVAKALHYSTPQFVSNWERGVSLPPLDALPKLAVLFKAQPKEIIEVIEKYQEQILKKQRKVLIQLFKEARRA